MSPHGPGIVRKALGKLARSPRHDLPPTPGSRSAHRVSVVVTVKKPEAPFLDECLASLAAQTHPDLEVLLVGYGAGAAAALRSARDPGPLARSMTVVEETPGTLGAARNLGAGRASGEYVTFLSAADTLPRGALLQLARSLDESGSDLARGHVVPAPGVVTPAAAQHRLAAARGVTLDQIPLAMTDLFAGGVVLRRSFWQRARLAFPDDDGSVLDAGIAEALVRASAIDVVATPAYRYQERGSGKVIGVAADPAAELDEWLATQHRVGKLLPAEVTEARLAWLAGVLGAELADLLDEIDTMDAAQWRRLVDTVRDLTADAPPALWQYLAVEPRLRAWLLAHDRRPAIERLVEERRFERGHVDTVVEDGVVLARLPFLRDPVHGVPDHVYELADWETPLVASLRRAAWNADGGLDLELFVLVRGVATADAPPTVRLALVEAGSGRRHELDVQHGVDREVTRFAGDKYLCYDHGLVRTAVDVPRLVEDGEGPQTWELHATVEAHGVRRSGPVEDRDAEGSASVSHLRTLGWSVVGLRTATDGPVVGVTVTPARARLEQVGTDDRTVSGRVSLSSDLAPAAVLAVRGDQTVSAPLHWSGDEATFELVLPEPEDAPGPGQPEPGPWRLRLDCGERVPLAWPEHETALWLGEGPTSRLAARRTPSGNAEVVEVAGAAELLGLDLAERTTTLRARWLGVPPPGAGLALVGPRCTLHAPRTEGSAPGELVVELPLTWDEWGLGATFAPLGTYRPVVTAPDAEEQTLFASADLADRFPELHENGAYRLRLVRSGNRASVKLHTPWADDELGRYAQQVLRTHFATDDLPLDESAVYLQSYTGHSATDSQLAIHEELRRTRPDLTLHWAVVNAATRVPEGGVPVLMHSRRWYELLGTAKYVVTNVDLERWFRRRPGQRVLQTFHGYPSKSMGIAMWKAKGFSERKVRDELRRTSGDWDLILTPAPAMDEHYRREYAYGGPILSHGYPRDDVFLGDRAEPVRRRTRELLGIRPDQTVVLYAPTWRDDLAARFGTSRLVQHLDLEQAAGDLGDDHVLLMRGHRYHPPESSSRSGPRVIDVTTYPEINDLLLASDVAVLDYSSIRFDFALTGRPMVFLVPDLQQYTSGARGFLYPFEDSAPGPLLENADQVVEALRDLDAVRRDHAAAYERFNATYNHRQDGRSAERVVRTFFDPA